jgi:P4 family phage/plasmid primase-like protien
MDDFRAYGGALAAAGYLIVPIKPGHKRPALERWQEARLTTADLERYPGHGVGVLCGQGEAPIAALDIDTTDESLAIRFAAWCADHLGLAPERVGQAPKRLLVYRAAGSGWAKAASAWFEDAGGGRHRLEVLGKGQQFVAYHVHPDTGRPYEWVDLFGGLDAVPVDSLPVIGHEQVAEAVQVFEAMALEAGLKRVEGSRAKMGAVTSAPVDDPLMAYEPPVGLSLAEAERWLACLDNEDYDTWIKAGMCLHHEFGGSDEALALWDRWSSTATNYIGFDDLARRWAGFGSCSQPVTARWLLKVGREGEREAELAEKRAALEEVKALVRECGDSIRLISDVARRAGAVAGDDRALRAELAGAIRARFKELTGTALPVADVRAAMGHAPTPTVLRRRPMTEFGNAERLLDRYGDGLMYVPETDAWYTWTGVYWKRAPVVMLEHMAKETVRALIDEAAKIENDEERMAFLKFCSISQRAVVVRAMVELAKSDPRVVVGASELDKHRHLFGVKNGAIDLRTGKLLPPDPSYRITMQAAVEYDPDAECPLFMETLRLAMFDDAEMMAFLQRLCGYAMLGNPNEDIIVIPYGLGSNGKSTIFGAVQHAFGDYAKMAGADTFLRSGQGGSSNAGGAREDVLRLRGARFVYVNEPDQNSELKEGIVKSMTGGEAIPARGLYSRSTIEVEPTWVAIVPTNYKPIIKGDDHAIWRRILLIPFLRQFDKDPSIKLSKGHKEAVKSDNEARGVMAWCVRGALAYQKEGLKPPAQVIEAREEYRTEMDLLADWIEECCEVGPEFTESMAKLWASWESYAKDKGVRYISSDKALARKLEVRGFRGIRDHGGMRGRWRIGIRVKKVGDFS